MAFVQQYAVVLLISWASGISLYLSVALAGISARMGLIDLPGSLDVITHPLVITLAVALYAIEFFADKIPWVDSTWDSIHTFIRPLGASVVGFLAGTDYGPLAQTTFAVATGAIALDVHAVKASSRVAINASPEPVTNITASVVEDSIVVAAFWFFVKHPFITASIIILTLVASFFILRGTWRFLRRLFRR